MVNNIIYFEKKPILDTNTHNTHTPLLPPPPSLSLSLLLFVWKIKSILSKASIQRLDLFLTRFLAMFKNTQIPSLTFIFTYAHRTFRFVRRNLNFAIGTRIISHTVCFNELFIEHGTITINPTSLFLSFLSPVVFSSSRLTHVLFLSYVAETTRSFSIFANTHVRQQVVMLLVRSHIHIRGIDFGTPTYTCIHTESHAYEIYIYVCMCIKQIMRILTFNEQTTNELTPKQ